MKFKGSVHQTRINNFWNEEVVKQYKELTNYLKSKAFFKRELMTCTTHLTKYTENLMNVVNNLHRIQDNYSEQPFFTKYLKDTIDTGISDLGEFKKLMVAQFKENANDSLVLIDATLDKLKVNATKEQAEVLTDFRTAVYSYY